MNFITFGKRQNPVVIFLHGWGGSVNSFLGVARVISSFGFYAVVLDFAGFGKTKEPDEPKSIYDYATDVEEFIEKYGFVDAYIVGHSFGGRVALILASRGLAKKLVLVDSAGLKPRRGLKYKIKVLKYKRIKEKVRAGILSKDVLEKFGSDDYRVLSPVMKETFVKVVNEDLAYLLSSVKQKTLIIWGKFDKDTPMYMARKFRRGIENSRLLVYNAGHYSYLEQMEKFVNDLYEFFIINDSEG